MIDEKKYQCDYFFKPGSDHHHFMLSRAGIDIKMQLWADQPNRYAYFKVRGTPIHYSDYKSILLIMGVT